MALPDRVASLYRQRIDVNLPTAFLMSATHPVYVEGRLAAQTTSDFKIRMWPPTAAVAGLFSRGYCNTVFDRVVTFTHWLREEYLAVRLFRDVDHEMTAEFLSDKAETCTPDRV